MKKLWKGQFNYHGEITILYRYAHSPTQAFNLFCRILKEKYQREVKFFFMGTDKYLVREEKK